MVENKPSKLQYCRFWFFHNEKRRKFGADKTNPSLGLLTSNNSKETKEKVKIIHLFFKKPPFFFFKNSSFLLIVSAPKFGAEIKPNFTIKVWEKFYLFSQRKIIENKQNRQIR